MYRSVEKQLNAITNILKDNLLSAKAIDASGKAIDIAKFNKIIDQAIDQCNTVLATTEKDGTTVDPYGANLAYSRVQWLEDIKTNGSIDPFDNMFDTVQDVTEEIKESDKPAKFGSGIKKVINKIRTRFKPSNEINR
jgi:hypothetical protein